MRVLLSTAPPDGTTKFVDQIVREAPASVQFAFFSWRAALTGRFDVFHVHWPEALIRGRTWWVRAARALLMAVLLLRIRVRRIPVVRTLHNLRPHEDGPRYERLILRSLDRLTTLVVKLNAASPDLDNVPSVLIPHGDYVGAFQDYERAPLVAGRVLYFGRVQAYKGVDLLIAAFAEIDDENISLRLVGHAERPYSEALREAMNADTRISADLRFVPDADLVREVSASSLVVLPYREMHNSGVLFVSLSIGVPTLAPRTPSNELVRDEVGDQWLRLYDGPFTGSVLSEALTWARAADRDQSPSLSLARRWAEVGKSYERAYRSVARTRR